MLICLIFAFPAGLREINKLQTAASLLASCKVTVRNIGIETRGFVTEYFSFMEEKQRNNHKNSEVAWKPESQKMNPIGLVGKKDNKAWALSLPK